MVDKKDARPIVVCGLPRSGTSLVRELLNAHSRVLILDEFPTERCPSLFSLGGELRELVGAAFESWRQVEKEELERRLALFLGSAWALASRPEIWRRWQKGDFFRFGMKTPSAELSFSSLQGLLGNLRPQWVYTLRNPLGVYESLLEVPWGGMEPAAAVERFLASHAALTHLVQEAPGDLFFFPVDRATSSLRQRLLIVRQLMAFLDLGVPLSVLRFIFRWPPINRREKLPQRRLLDEDTKREKLAVFAQTLAQYPQAHRFFFSAPKATPQKVAVLLRGEVPEAKNR